MIIINLFRWFFLGLYTVITIIPRSFIIGLICIINPKKGEILKYKGKPVIPMIMLSLTLTTYFICIFISSRWYVQKLKINYLSNDILSNTEILEKENKETINKENYIPNQNNEYSNISYMSVNLKDKMALLNGECGGTIYTSVTHSPIYNADGTEEPVG